MPTVLTEVDSYDASITVPAAGDLRTASSVQTAFQSLANRTKFFSRLINGGTFTLGAPLVFDGAVSVKGGMTIGDSGADSHTVNGTFNCLNVLQASGGFVIPSTSSGLIEAPIVLSGAGRVRQRVVSLGDSNATITPQTADLYYIGPTTLTSNSWILTIDDSGCANGDELVVHNADVNNSIQVNGPGAVPLCNLTSDPASALRSWAVFTRIAGTWTVRKMVNT